MDRTGPLSRLRLGPAPGLAAQLYPARQSLDGDQAGMRALLLWLHGGHFTDGSLGSGRARSEMLAEAGADVVALDYPLAPEHPFPTGLAACFAALQDLAARPARLTGSARTALFVGGEEAGGNIAAALALMARDQHAPALAGQLLVSPMLDPQLASASMRKGECGGRECRYAKGWKAYLGDGIRADHPYAAPAKARRLAGLAPALLLYPADHPLNDESQRYAVTLNEQGVGARGLALTSLSAGHVMAPVRDFLHEAARRVLG